MIQYLHEGTDEVCSITFPVGARTIVLFAVDGAHKLLDAPIGERNDLCVNEHSIEAETVLAKYADSLSACTTGDGETIGYRFFDRIPWYMPTVGWPKVDAPPAAESICTHFERDQLEEYDDCKLFVDLIIAYVCTNRDRVTYDVVECSARLDCDDDDFEDVERCECEFCATYRRSLERQEYSPSTPYVVAVPAHRADRFLLCLRNARLVEPVYYQSLAMYNKLNVKLNENK